MRFLPLLTLPVCLFTVAAFFSRANVAFDVICNFRAQYFLFLFLMAGLFLFSRQWTWGIIALVFAGLNFMEILPLYLPQPRPTAPIIQQFSLLQMNVFRDNIEHQKVQDLIAKKNPDFVALEEITPEWEKLLETTHKQYPYRMIRPKKDSFGIALLSKIPFEEGSDFKYYGDARNPSVVAHVTLAGQPLTLVVVHPYSPRNPERVEIRNHQFSAMANARADFRENFLLVGDFNTASWSDSFQQLLRKLELHDSRKGFGLQPTWPTYFPLMLTPIDHCILSERLVTLTREIQPSVGSDHYPVYLELGLTGTSRHE